MTDGGGCENCDALALQIAALEAELEDAQQALEIIRSFCQEAASRADGVLSQPSGVPRGRWAFVKGAREIAVRVLALVC